MTPCLRRHVIWGRKNELLQDGEECTALQKVLNSAILLWVSSLLESRVLERPGKGARAIEIQFLAYCRQKQDVYKFAAQLIKAKVMTKSMP